MNEENIIVLEWTQYGRLKTKEIDRKKMLDKFSSIEGLFRYEEFKTYDEVKTAIKTAQTIRWYENFNDGTSNAIMCDQKKVIKIPWICRLIVKFFEEYLVLPIEYTYFTLSEEKIKKTFYLNNVYPLFDAISKNFEEDNKYSKEIQEYLKSVIAFEFHEKNKEIKFFEGKVTTSFCIPDKNTIVIEILRKLAM